MSMPWISFAEYSARRFFRLFDSLHDCTVATLQLRLPSKLVREQTSRIVLMFESARSKLMFTFALKLTCFMDPPGLLSALAHHNLTVVSGAMETCLQSDCKHPRILELQKEPLISAAELFLFEGKSLEELPGLELFIAQFRWGFSSARRVEIPHGQFKLEMNRSRHRTQASDSLVLRMPELRKEILAPGCSETMKKFVTILEGIRSPKACARALGLGNHPELSRAGLHAWCSIFRKVIYRSDPYTLSHAPTAGIFVAAHSSWSHRQCIANRRSKGRAAFCWRAGFLYNQFLRKDLEERGNQASGALIFFVDACHEHLQLPGHWWEHPDFARTIFKVGNSVAVFFLGRCIKLF